MHVKLIRLEPGDMLEIDLGWDTIKVSVPVRSDVPQIDYDPSHSHLQLRDRRDGEIFHTSEITNRKNNERSRV